MVFYTALYSPPNIILSGWQTQVVFETSLYFSQALLPLGGDLRILMRIYSTTTEYLATVVPSCVPPTPCTQSKRTRKAANQS
mmetsp:Transcript_94992/g.159503  ORF Transcript_94992/g.159503 Transcript_94992/m.159503 type:complete len:82 (+) Transcript_94992:225-470(+)